jgi:hypothetical protein
LPSEVYSQKKSDEKSLNTIVELVDPSLVDVAKSILSFDWSN